MGAHGKKVDGPSVVRRLLEVLDGAQSDAPGPQLEATVRAYVEAQEVHVSPRHAQTTSRRLARLLGEIRSSVRIAGGRLEYVADLSSTAVDTWMRGALSAGAAPATVRQTVGALKTALGWAVKRGLIDRSPIDAVQLPAVGRARQKKPRARPTPAQVYALLESAWRADERGMNDTRPGQGRWIIPQYPLLWTLIRTGARRGELVAMIRDDYRREEMLMRIRAETAKTRRGRLIPLAA